MGPWKPQRRRPGCWSWTTRRTILELLSGSLRLAGFEVVTAASGAEAVRAAASSRPDLVLLDVMLPDGDGFEALRRIRSGVPRFR